MLVTNIRMVWSGKLTFFKIAFLVLHVALVTCIESKLVRQDTLVREDTIACSLNCERNGSDTDIILCNHTTGECMLGCKAGFAEPNCTLQCSDIVPNCNICSTDLYSSGFVCTQCNRNFYRGNGKCLACNYWCAINSSSPLAICRESDGYCQHGCRSGRYGYNCGVRCSSTCRDICHRDTGMCVNGCWYTSYCGPTCEIACQDGCVSQHCNQSCSCANGCNTNYWGEKCQNLCNSNCNIPTLNSNTCDTANGSCIYGCQNTFWGFQCTNSCSPYCLNGTCHQMSGNCSVGCLSNQTYGGNCSIPCNQNCKNCICDRNNGHCQLGCSTGWYGEMCDKQCNGNCFTNSCNQSDGTCVYGCKIGWYGEQCTQQCSDGCLDKICLVDTGNCSRGCAPGYKGPQCDKDLESQKMCYECDNMSSPQYCDSVANCQASETCFIESHKAAHGKKFRSGCMDEKKCRMLESANTTSVCVECCYNSMCNNRGCGNTDFPSREHRGPMCFDCLHTGDPKTCDTVSMCTPNQVCSIEKFQWGEGFHYKQGCANKVCNSLSYHKRSIPLCHSCCQDDYCNRNCTSNTSNNGEIFVG